MNLVLIWIVVTVLMGLALPNLYQYLLFCVIMFFVTYIYNEVNPTTLNLKFFCLFISIPSSIMWWILYIYNDFLTDFYIDEPTVLFVIAWYFYMLFWIAWMSSFKK